MAGAMPESIYVNRYFRSSCRQGEHPLTEATEKPLATLKRTASSNPVWAELQRARCLGLGSGNTLEAPALGWAGARGFARAAGRDLSLWGAARCAVLAQPCAVMVTTILPVTARPAIAASASLASASAKRAPMAGRSTPSASRRCTAA